MLHSGSDAHTAPWLERVKRSAQIIVENPTHLLGFNEPDMCDSGAGGSCMDVEKAVAKWKEFMEPAKAFKPPMYFGSPAVTNASGSKQGLNWLRAFMEQCSDCKVDFICIHW